MKRVLHVVGKMNIGGAEQLLMNIYRNIDRSKIQFDFLTFYKQGESGYYDQEIIELGGRIINISKPSKIRFYHNVKNVVKILVKEQYAAVHTHIGSNCAYALVAAKKTNVPIRIAHAHNTPNPNRSLIIVMYENIMKGIINKCLTKCCACSKRAGDYRFTAKNMNERYTFIPNSVDFSRYLMKYERDAIREQIGIKNNELLVLQVGNFKEQKNQLFSIEILKRLKGNKVNCRFVFAGRNSFYGSMVADKIKKYQLEDNTLLLGQRTDIPELMTAADVLIMPSIWEGLGIVLLEAQASGLPCVVSNAIQPEADLGAGLLKICNLDNLNMWEKNILDAVEYERLSQEQRIDLVKASLFTLENAIKCFLDLYEI